MRLTDHSITSFDEKPIVLYQHKYIYIYVVKEHAHEKWRTSTLRDANETTDTAEMQDTNKEEQEVEKQAKH